MTPTPAPTEEEIATLAHKLIAWYSWKVVEAQPLVERAREWLAAGTRLEGSYGLERLCERAAAEQLYATIERGELRTASKSEKDRWQLAYQDLHNYLTAAARRMARPAAPDATWDSVVQDTLVDVRAGLKKLDEPQLLLAWAVGILDRKRIGTWREWRKSGDRTQPLEGEDGLSQPEKAILRNDREILDDVHRRVDPQGDTEFFTIIRECLRNDQERTIALCLSFGMKRREIMLVFASLAERFDTVRRALLSRFRECARVRALFDPSAGSPAVCAASGCPLTSLGGRRSSGT